MYRYICIYKICIYFCLYIPPMPGTTSASPWPSAAAKLVVPGRRPSAC